MEPQWCSPRSPAREPTRSGSSRSTSAVRPPRRCLWRRKSVQWRNPAPAPSRHLDRSSQRAARGGWHNPAPSPRDRLGVPAQGVPRGPHRRSKLEDPRERAWPGIDDCGGTVFPRCARSQARPAPSCGPGTHRQSSRTQPQYPAASTPARPLLALLSGSTAQQYTPRRVPRPESAARGQPAPERPASKCRTGQAEEAPVRVASS